MVPSSETHFAVIEARGGGRIEVHKIRSGASLRREEPLSSVCPNSKRVTESWGVKENGYAHQKLMSPDGKG